MFLGSHTKSRKKRTLGPLGRETLAEWVCLHMLQECSWANQKSLWGLNMSWVLDDWFQIPVTKNHKQKTDRRLSIPLASGFCRLVNAYIEIIGTLLIWELFLLDEGCYVMFHFIDWYLFLCIVVYLFIKYLLMLFFTVYFPEVLFIYFIFNISIRHDLIRQLLPPRGWKPISWWHDQVAPYQGGNWCLKESVPGTRKNGYISHLGKFGKSSTQNAFKRGYVRSQ